MKQVRLIALLSLIVLLGACGNVEENKRIESGNLVMENIPPIPESLKERLSQYQNVRSASLQDWLPNDGILISTRFGETSQLHRVNFPGGARYQLTFFNEPVSEAAVCPNAKNPLIVFMKDVGGNEAYQLFSMNLEDGTLTMLTNGKSRHGTPLWSHDGSLLAYSGTQRNGKDYDIYIAEATDLPKAKMVSQLEGYWEPLSWSPSNAKLILLNYISINESYLHILDVASGELIPMNPSPKKIAYGDAKWFPRGDKIFFLSDEDLEFQTLRTYDVASGRVETLPIKTSWDVSSFTLSPDGMLLAWVTNEDGLSRLSVQNLQTGSYLNIPPLPDGIISGLRFNKNGTELAFSLNTPTHPTDVYSIRLTNETLSRWTYSEVGGLNTETFVAPTLIHYPTFDSLPDGTPRQIPAFYYKAKSTEEKMPVIINIHGGPESQFRPSFSSTFQYILNEMGISILAPNVRGSSGYGKSYLLLDNGYKREHSVYDIGALLDWIAQQPELDENRVAVWGGSYGGYMVLASLTHYSDRIRAGVDEVGISNFVTFLENTQPYRQDLRRAEYGDERDPEMRAFLESIAPVNNAHKISSPLFIVQGLNDPRVPASEAEQILKVVKANNVETWYLLAKDEGHGFSKKSNSNFYIQSAMLFFEKFLKDIAE
ncbi:MAG: alpha/beta fold hydrolase [Candidatus Marinimicrobia bacterium]|nr:alpha/beta fold hydrolase [Candidatus Neomarinimicrobiota bacterium]MDD5582038.1 alpha/beta fold hydrolase [Candidatus Neomarinimicrobiota bacterium]